MLKSRSGQPVNASGTAVPSIELVRRRARHRLIGASVLVLAGVVGFSLLFDAQPRPIAVDIPIEIPSRSAPPAAAAPAAVTPAAPRETLADRAEAAADAAPAPEVSPPPVAAAPAQAPTPVPDPAPAAAPAPAAPVAPARPSPAPVPPAAGNDGARAQALLEGRSPAVAPRPTEAPVRLVVQVGAFADNARAQEVRMRLERAGLKTYTQVAETPEGRRIRVRVGPFDSQQEADRAAERVRALNLPARVLTL